ncbi:MAG: CPBP family intramembrane metalloprotease [Candidatus Methanofastidiosia archaeon]|jgi:membrane protease YdiL (CAAX protease family)
MSKLRVYIGSSMFVFFLSSFVADGYISLLATLIARGYLSYSRQYMEYIFPIFAVSLVVLSISYLLLFTPLQKYFARVTGEIYFCSLLASLFIIVFALIEVFPAFSSNVDRGQFFEVVLEKIRSLDVVHRVTLLLLILVYHFLVNKRTVEDLNIKDITHEIEYLVVAGIGFFCLFGVLYFQELITEGAFHLPTFENLVNLFLVVFVEEVMYRYYIQGKALEAFSRYRALLIASLLFTLVHLGPPLGWYHIYVFIGGLVYGYGYMRNQNLSVPLILHGLVNLLPVVLL